MKTNFTGSSKYSISVLHSNILIYKLALNSIERKEGQKIQTKKDKHEVAITLFLKKVDLKLCLTFHDNITGRSQRQVLFYQWQGMGPARTWRSAATDNQITQQNK